MIDAFRSGTPGPAGQCGGQRPGSRADGGAAGFRRFALWQDAAVSRGTIASADLLQYKPADKNTAALTLAELQALNPTSAAG
ncbi:MAG: hypothetical protein ACLTCJ_09695 [Gemmiger formicilis]|uniref:hypothetical protein n=1 Tax=Gemmiger formicilis TaxID=745368 RepID=UPI003A2738AE